MRLAECKDVGDVIKHLRRRGGKSGWYLLEVEQVHNMLIVTYGKPREETPTPIIGGHSLIMSTKIKKDKEVPMQFKRVKMDLSKWIEPYKSKKAYYDSMWANATQDDKKNLEIT